VATLLHDAAEILCWVFAPKLSLKLRDLLRANPTMRTAAAQRAVFNVTSHDLQLALARAWKLPALLVELMGGAANPSPRVRNVQYAINLARHSAKGWDDPALPDDFKDIEELLHISHETLLGRLGLPMDGSLPPTLPEHAEDTERSPPPPGGEPDPAP